MAIKSAIAMNYIEIQIKFNVITRSVSPIEGAQHMALIFYG